MTDTPMLDVRRIYAGYGETTVLRDVSVTVGEGSVVALLGPNGAGKTTLLKTVAGLLRPTSGSVVLEGDDVTGAAPERLSRRGLCHLPEGRGIFPSLTVRENVRAFALRRQDEGAAFEEASAAFPVLAERADQVAGTLSGGQQQMLALVRAWVRRPRLVLVDEPSIGLAPLVVDEVYEFLRQLRGTGASILLVEQYIDRALALADTVHVLVHGTIRHAGAADRLDREELVSHYMSADGDEVATRGR